MVSQLPWPVQKNMPTVSIVLPTYNRADTLPRAIASVLAQVFTDWELLVIDDGSTDNTTALFNNTDPRIRYVKQENGGCYVARNHGLRLSRGALITFLDSDDEWLPHYLSLVTSFFAARPDEHFVMTEFLADYGNHVMVREDLSLIGSSWPKMARKIGSPALDLPHGETDEYLRVYATREPLGSWGSMLAAKAGYPQAYLYRGKIFAYFRWGHMGWLPTTTITRTALEKVGMFSELYRTAADYRFLASLSRCYQANMIGVPSAVKYHFGIGGQSLFENHLAAGPHEYRYATARIPLFDEMFPLGDPPDRETLRIRGLYQLYAARTAIELGMRDNAVQHLKEARHALPDHLSIRALSIFLWCVRSDKLARMLYRKLIVAERCARLIVSGDFSISRALHKRWIRFSKSVRS
jgi:glycosyltransferase involved in cell wall biosynthesis